MIFTRLKSSFGFERAGVPVRSMTLLAYLQIGESIFVRFA